MRPITSRLALPALAVAALLGGCATVPVGPSMMALPGSTKSFDQFQHDDALCRQYAFGQSGAVEGEQRANAIAARDATVATVIGAAVGGAIDGSDGAAIGAGMGLLVGSAAGAESSRYSTGTMQYRYDQSYVQCMYGKGHKVPVRGNFVDGRGVQRLPVPAPASSPIPPPPPGLPPPPPPDAPR